MAHATALPLEVINRRIEEIRGRVIASRRRIREGRELTIQRDLRSPIRCTPGLAIDAGDGDSARCGEMYAEAPHQARKRLVGRNIRRYRRAAGLSQVRFAALLDVGQQVISRWEAGAREPNAANMARIADALGVPWQRFYEPDEDEAA